MSVFQDLKKSIVCECGAKADIVFPAQTIVIDHEALRDSPESRTRFTIAHECARLILHQNIYYRDPLMKCSSQSSYRPFTATSENVCTDTVDRAEFQANYLGAALLMSRTPFSDAYQRLVPGNWCDLAEWQKKAVISELADTFETSLFATTPRIWRAIHAWDKPAFTLAMITARSSTPSIRRQLTTNPSNSTTITQIAYTL